ncbi:bifunctional diguanylate cyclase/phosphodiesterase [Proteocatella sphenisci]|uniref:bifunctional diguanylate cyclase/phosphodiesterase n=1 Tax=Proteocatella sphenisci TaxID=181070 RepID=UPI00048D71C4|nr:EAL domain-containing protein [Proteocatella sphenisci]
MKNKKLYYKLAGMLLVTVFAVVSIFYFTFFKNSLMTEAQMHLNEITIQTAGRIEEKLISNKELIDTLAVEAKDFENHTEKDNISRLKGWAGKNTFTQISFADEKGMGYTSDGNHVDFSDSEFFEKALLGSGNISPVIRNYEGGFENIVIFTSPVYRDDIFKGVIYGLFEMENITKSLELEFFNGLGQGFIIDELGNVLAHSDEDMVKKNMFLEIARNNDSIDTQKIKARVLAMDSGNTVYVHKGTKYFVSFFPVLGEHNMSRGKSNSGMSVLMMVSYNRVFEQSNMIMRRTGSIVVMTFLLFCMIIAYVLYQKRVNEESLEKVAYEDELCKILNRKGFVRSANYMLRNSKDELVAICIDIDNFKITNSIFGYEFGDRVLKAMTSELQKAFGEDAVIGRINADNFNVIVGYASKNCVLREVEKIAEAMKNRFSSHKEILVSIGVYFVEDASEESKQIFDKAQLANKSVKYASKTPYAIYEESLKDEIEKENWLVEEMKKAIERKDFEVYYQPKFEIARERTVGAEALIRWNHTEKGFISPVEFIPLAEKTQLIVDIGRIVFEQVCKDMSSWKQKGMSPLSVAVNLSRVEIYQADVVGNIKNMMKIYEIPGNLIQIEITETVAVNEYEDLRGVLLQLNELGISISIDDFGSGYSSLACLHKLNVDTLKLDRSFLVNLDSDEKGINILRGMIELSRELGLRTVCEGIETREQMEMLKQMNCRYGQGFIFARPMPLKELEKFLKDKQ